MNKLPRLRDAVLRTALILCLGIALNIAIAWACAWRSELSDSGPGGLLPSNWPEEAPESWPDRPEYVFIDSGFGIQSQTLNAGERQISYRMYLYQTGWPLPSMRWSVQGSGFWNRPLNAAEMASTGLDMGDTFFPNDQSAEKRRLPLIPIWLGFIVNSLLYSALFWFIFAGPFSIHRLRRRLRHQCMRCGYPIGTSDVCTECGRAVR